MTDELDPIVSRLRALGRRPVEPALQSDHLTRMAATSATPAGFRSAFGTRVKIGVGVLAGFLIGATGLTTAGAMGPLQPVAANVVEATTPLSNLPQSASTKAKGHAADDGSHDDVAGESKLPDGSIGTQRVWKDCVPGSDGLFAGNRGRYLKQERAKGADALAAAKASDCGKPVDTAADPASEHSTEPPEAEGDDDHRPADAGKPANSGKSDDRRSDDGESDSDRAKRDNPKKEEAKTDKGDAKADDGADEVESDHHDDSHAGDAARTSGSDDENRSGRRSSTTGSTKDV